MDGMMTNDLQWHNSKWLSNGNAKITDQNTSAKFAKQSDGPVVLYEISNATGECLTGNGETKKTVNINSLYGIDKEEVFSS